MYTDIIRSGRYGIAYANGRWIAVTGGGGCIFTSTDGTNWTIQGISYINNCHDVAYANGIWMIAGYGGNSGKIAISTDNGANWTTQTVGTAYCQNITYSNGTWVVVSCYNQIVTSTDNGRNWTIKTISDEDTRGRIKIACNNNTWVAVGTRGDDIGGCIATSTDNGVTWTRKDPYRIFCRYAWRNIAYHNGMWIAVGDKNNGRGCIATSTNGTDWQTQQDVCCVGNQHIAYTNGTWIAVGNSIVTSTNGRDWTYGRTIDSAEAAKAARNHYKSTSNWNRAAHNNCRWIAVGVANRMAVSVDNGVTWTVGQVGKYTNWRGIAYGNGVWIAVGNNKGQQVKGANGVYYISYYDGEENNCIAISTDNGKNWTLQQVHSEGRSDCFGYYGYYKDKQNYSLTF
jgi:hypothetical protein